MLESSPACLVLIIHILFTLQKGSLH